MLPAMSLDQRLLRWVATGMCDEAPSGEPAVRELLLDRRPWRDVLGP